MGTFNRMVEAAEAEGRCCRCWKPAPEPHPEALAESGMPVCDDCAPGVIREQWGLDPDFSPSTQEA